MGFRIGDVFLALLADDARLKPEVEKAAAEAGDAGAKTLGQKLGAGLKTAGVKAFGIAATAAFSLATKGALELGSVQADIQAATGDTAEEARKLAAAVNKGAADNQLALSDVSQAAINVRKDLGAAGDEAGQLTQDFARFAKVTKQGAGAAVSDFDDILDAWGLTTKDVTRLQDQLLKSNQKFGGSITDNQKALADFAPALQAMGGSVDDGIALLNLFAASGIDASATTRALNTAVKNLKPGQSLNDLVAQIAAIEDPAKRAQEAIRVFGSRGGVALANALKPGMTSLDDFAVSAADAAGTVAKAGKAIDDKWLGIPKLLSQAKGALRSFGQDLGPALTGIGAIGSLVGTLFPNLGGAISKKIAGAFGKVASSAAVKAAAAAAGAAGGAIYGAAAGAAENLIGALAGAWKLVPGSALVTGAIGAVGTAIATSLAAAVAAGLASFGIGLLIAQWIKDASGIGAEEWQGLVYDKYARMGGQELPANVKASTKAQGEKLADEWGTATLGIPKAIGRVIRKGSGDVDSAIESLLDPSGNAGVESAIAGLRALGEKVPESIGEGILAKQSILTDALASLRNLMQNELTPAGQIARNIGILTSAELAAGLNDNRPGVKAEAQRVQQTAETELADLIAKGGGVGRKASAELAAGLNSKDPAVRAAAQRVKAIVDTKLREVAASASAAGTKAGNAFAVAFRNAGKTITLVASVKVKSNAQGNVGARAKGGPTSARKPYWVGEKGPELFVPETNGTVLTHAESVRRTAGAESMAGGDTYNIPLNITGVLRAETPADVVRPMRQLAASGAISNPRRRQRVEVPTRA